MPSPAYLPRELQVLEQFEINPTLTQADLAKALGVAVGTVNFVVKRLIQKGCLRVKRLERKRLKYIITPAGVALRTQLAMDSVRYSMRLYRETRQQAQRLIGQACQQGYGTLTIQGNGELAEVVRLTCLEMAVAVGPDGQAGALPAIVIIGTSLKLELPASRSGRKDPSRSE